jgi:hypothetical protein
MNVSFRIWEVVLVRDWVEGEGFIHKSWIWYELMTNLRSSFLFIYIISLSESFPYHVH